MDAIEFRRQVIRAVNTQFNIWPSGFEMALSDPQTRSILTDLQANPAYGAYTSEVMHALTPDPFGPSFNPPYNYDNITLKQKWLKQNLGSPKLIGTQVMMVCRLDGQPVTRGPWRGKIIKVLGYTEGASLVGVDVVVALEDGTEYLAKYYQIEPIKAVKPKEPSKRELAAKEKTEKEFFLTDLAKCHADKSNQAIISTRNLTRSLKNDISSYEDALRTAQNKLKDTEKKLATMQEVSLTSQDFIKIIDELKKHEKVEMYYLTKNKQLVVFTKMLYASNYKTGIENEKMPLGRFVFNISLTQPSRPTAVNLDFIYQDHYFHPNINGASICLGNNEQEVLSLVKDGAIYQLVDLLITFFSTFPHLEGANPYIDFEQWYQERTFCNRDTSGVRSYINAVVSHPYIGGKFTYDPLNPPATDVPRELINKQECADCGSNEHTASYHDDETWDDDNEEAEDAEPTITSLF